MSRLRVRRQEEPGVTPKLPIREFPCQLLCRPGHVADNLIGSSQAQLSFNHFIFLQFYNIFARMNRREAKIVNAIKLAFPLVCWKFFLPYAVGHAAEEESLIRYRCKFLRHLLDQLIVLVMVQPAVQRINDGTTNLLGNLLLPVRRQLEFHASEFTLNRAG